MIQSYFLYSGSDKDLNPFLIHSYKDVPKAALSVFSETTTSCSQEFGGHCAVWRKEVVQEW